MQAAYARNMQYSSLGISLGLLLTGCGGGDSAKPDAASKIPDAPPAGGLTLTSSAFAEGGAIPIASTCKDPANVNSSPQLSWTGAPSGTMSFAVVLTDLSLTPPLVHWVIYDIPASATGLPANVEKAYAPANVAGTHQTASYDNQTRGYLGPCPPAKHTYQFEVYALLAATLPGTTMQTTRNEAVPTITALEIAHATLKGTFTPP